MTENEARKIAKEWGSKSKRDFHISEDKLVEFIRNPDRINDSYRETELSSYYNNEIVKNNIYIMEGWMKI